MRKISQIALPLGAAGSGPAKIVIGMANAHVADALYNPHGWPFNTAVLTGPARSGKSLLARWFVQSGHGLAVDNAHLLDEAALFHRWNRAQEQRRPLLLVGGEPPWTITLPDLRSRIGAALQLEIDQPDELMAGELLLSMAAERGLALGMDAVDYIVPRAGRAPADLERLVATIDRLSLERKAPATQSIWRAALEAVHGPEEPRLL